MPCSKTPAEPVSLAIAAFPVLPPVPTRRGLQRLHDFEAATGLQYPLSTLHERRCRRPRKTRFRLAGSAFTGRASNPLGHDERFQATSVLLSRTFPDASWAHGRRKFFKLAEIARAPLALEAVRRIDAIFAAERAINGKPAEQRLASRRRLVAPLVAELERWMRPARARLSRHSDVAKAMDYMLKRCGTFTRFLDDGRICLTNNAAERALRGIALGRKSWLFAGSDRGGERAAAMYSLIVTCKLNGVDPRAWLVDVLARIADHLASRLHELLPWNWRQQAAPVAVAA